MLSTLLLLSVILGVLSVLFPVSAAVTTPLFIIFAIAWYVFIRRSVGGASAPSASSVPAGASAAKRIAAGWDFAAEHSAEGRLIKGAALSTLSFFGAAGIMVSAYLVYTGVHSWWAWVLWLGTSMLVGFIQDQRLSDLRKRRALARGRRVYGETYNHGFYVPCVLASWLAYLFYLPSAQQWDVVLLVPTRVAAIGIAFLFVIAPLYLRPQRAEQIEPNAGALVTAALLVGGTVYAYQHGYRGWWLWTLAAVGSVAAAVVVDGLRAVLRTAYEPGAPLPGVARGLVALSWAAYGGYLAVVEPWALPADIAMWLGSGFLALLGLGVMLGANAQGVVDEEDDSVEDPSTSSDIKEHVPAEGPRERATAHARQDVQPNAFQSIPWTATLSPDGTTGMSWSVRADDPPAEDALGRTLALKQQLAQAIDRYRPDIHRLLRERGVLLARDVLNNEAAMARCFALLYEFLPAPVRLAVGEERFIAYCQQHRSAIVEQLCAEKPESDAGYEEPA